MENCPLPITDTAIQQIPAIAALCMHFKNIIEMNELEISQYSKMDMSAKLHLARTDFVKLL